MNREFLEWIKTAPVGSGVCMCGESIEEHYTGNHAAVDVWDHSLGQWLLVLEAQAVLLEEALVRLVAVEQNAANSEKWRELLESVRGRDTGIGIG